MRSQISRSQCKYVIFWLWLSLPLVVQYGYKSSLSCGANNNNSSLQSIFDVFRKAWSDRNLLSRAIEPIEWIWPTDLFPPQILQKWIDRLNTFACFSNHITFLTSYNFRSITQCFIKEDNFFRAFPCVTCKKESYRIWRKKKKLRFPYAFI